MRGRQKSRWSRWLLSGWVAATLALVAAQLAWTDWGFDNVERCHREVVDRLGFERVSGAGPADIRRWPPGLRCHINDCPGWSDASDATTRRCQVGPPNRIVELAASPVDWAFLVFLAAIVAAALMALLSLAVLPFKVLRRHPDLKTPPPPSPPEKPLSR